MQPLTVSLIQSNLFWEDKAKNLEQFSAKFDALPKEAQVVFLPEMFSTGFSMKPEELAETMDGPTVQWMKEMSRKHRKIITGSIIIEEDGHYYNRLIWMLPNGQSYHYDKRHLFGFAGEDQHYTAGEKRLIVQVNGWKICLMVCYDLRFPVWARQKPLSDSDEGPAYDVLVYVANWPQRRSHPWKTLLQARAIENQSYVVGVNRVGDDGNGIYHSGDSMLVNPVGEIIWQQADDEAVFTFTLQPESLKEVRDRFPFLNDADNFMLL
jgi:omega-amidase